MLISDGKLTPTTDKQPPTFLKKLTKECHAHPIEFNYLKIIRIEGETHEQQAD